MNGKNSRREALSWFLIIFLFASGGWPIALFLLIRKLFSSDIPKKERREPPSLSQEEELKRQAEELERMKKKFHQEKATQKAKEAIKSLVKSPRDNDKNSLLLMIAGALLMIGAVLVGVQSAEVAAGAYAIASAVAAFLGGGCMFSSGILMRRAMQRYTSYLAIIGPNEALDKLKD